MFQPFSTEKYHDIVDTVVPIRANGRIKKVVGLVIEASGPASQIGCVCDIATEGGGRRVKCRGIGLQGRFCAAYAT